jgi:hypothetical protein
VQHPGALLLLARSCFEGRLKDMPLKKQSSIARRAERTLFLLHCYTCSTSYLEICMYVCMYIRMYILAWRSSRRSEYTHTHIHTYIHTYTHTHTHTHTQYICVCVYIYYTYTSYTPPPPTTTPLACRRTSSTDARISTHTLNFSSASLSAHPTTPPPSCASPSPVRDSPPRAASASVLLLPPPPPRVLHARGGARRLAARNVFCVSFCTFVLVKHAN